MHTFVHTYILLHGASEKGQLLRRGGNTTTATVLASKNEQATKTTHDTHTHVHIHTNLDIDDYLTDWVTQ